MTEPMPTTIMPLSACRVSADFASSVQERNLARTAIALHDQVARLTAIADAARAIAGDREFRHSDPTFSPAQQVNDALVIPASYAPASLSVGGQQLHALIDAVHQLDTTK